MRVLCLVGMLLVTHASAVAQDRIRVHEIYGSPRYEERSLNNGLHLAVTYDAGGDIAFFAISGVAWSSRRDSKALFDEKYYPAIDESDARAVVELLFASSPWRLETLDYRGRRPSWGIESYRLGHLCVLFSFDNNDRLTDVVGVAGIIGPHPHSPPN